jgi:hypothetical protein
MGAPIGSCSSAVDTIFNSQAEANGMSGTWPVDEAAIRAFAGQFDRQP